MKKVQTLLLVVLVLSLTSSATMAETAAERPDGISAGNWIAITDSLGFVITSEETLPVPSALLLEPPVAGYFMVKREGGWTRIIVTTPLQGAPPAG